MGTSICPWWGRSATRNAARIIFIYLMYASARPPRNPNPGNLKRQLRDERQEQ
jgi:hypothetical protein